MTTALDAPSVLILASTSVYRRALLDRIGIPYRAVAPAMDEVMHKRELGAAAPEELARALATAKARSLHAAYPDATIIGSDQVVVREGRLFEKPGDRERAIRQLEALSGHTHEILTALTVRHGDRNFEHLDRTRLRMRVLERAEIERYVDADQPFDCAGSYKLEAKGITLFEAIESADQTAIVVLPLIALVSILRPLGFTIP